LDIQSPKALEASNFNESLVAAFERVATKFPSRTALGSETWEQTYSELNETTGRLAHRLIECGVGLGDRVAILMSHDAPMVAAMLAILKAGAIAVALDPGDPPARTRLLVEDSEPSVIVTDLHNGHLAAGLMPLGCRILNFESESTNGPAENPSIQIPPEQTAVLIYTSGTTGRPKGVMKSHRQLCRAAAAHTSSMQSTEHDRIPLFASISTGQGISLLWWILLNGAMLLPFPVKQRGVGGLADWIIDCDLTLYASSASIFRALIKTIDERLVFPKVRAAWLASEGITADDVRSFRRHFSPSSALVHGLSSSETSIIAWSRWMQHDDVPEGALPVGNFTKDLEILLLEDDGQPVALGEVGEITVRSRYVANGYWRDPELTGRHISDDLDGKGTRLVWTGDLGRINTGGMLEFCGRKDDRIKIRGNRIELAEIERSIEGLAGIEHVAVVAVQHEMQEAVLTAFVVKERGTSWTGPTLQRALRANLPLHMVPSRIVFLDSLPYNRGNKVDRVALRQYALPVREAVNANELRTDTEDLLASIWMESLEVPHVGLDDDFFELGGDSLKGAIVAAHIHTALDVELSLAAIAEYPTLSALAKFIDISRRREAERGPPVVAVPRAISIPLSLAQEGMWPQCQSPGFTNVQVSRIVGPLDVEVYKECLGYLVDRHEILRTTFSNLNDRPAQTIHPYAPLNFSVIDLTGYEDAEHRSDAIFRESAARAIDLQTQPIMSHILVKIADDHYRLARISNFMIADGFSGKILESELAALYEARLQSREPPLSRRAPLQYADYAAWQRQVFRPDGPRFRETTRWWENLLSSAPPVTRLPFKRLKRRDGLDPSEGVLRWRLSEQAARRLDEVAHEAGTTPFIMRLAAFAALIADAGGHSTVVLGTFFDNRNRADAQTVVGRIVNWLPLVLSCAPSKTIKEWAATVHDRVFETLAHGEAPFEKVKETLRPRLAPPEARITFMLSRDHPNQLFGNLSISNEPFAVGNMPGECTVYIDGKIPENCQVMFDANLYGRKEMSAFVNRYLQFLELAAHRPQEPIEKLLGMTSQPLRLTCAYYATKFHELLKEGYASSPLLQRMWRPIKKRLLGRA
jgi:nonribosomal peptide synthetase DhbF